MPYVLTKSITGEDIVTPSKLVIAVEILQEEYYTTPEGHRLLSVERGVDDPVMAVAQYLEVMVPREGYDADHIKRHLYVTKKESFEDEWGGVAVVYEDWAIIAGYSDGHDPLAATGDAPPAGSESLEEDDDEEDEDEE